MNDFIESSLKKLKNRNIPNPTLDLRILLKYSSTAKKEIFLSNFNLNQINKKKFNQLLIRRLNYEPISKIINKKSFWKYDFFVNNNVLDPRPETEIIIEESLKIINKKEKISILDIGTGSGCLAISLAKEFKNSKVTAIDISGKAIQIAKKNAALNKCKNQINFKNCGFELINKKFDLIVSNPPYLTEKEYKMADYEIKNYEPKIAFLAGKNGLYFYQKFSKLIDKIMKNKSYLIFEIGEKQALNCKKLFNKSHLKFEKKVKDLQKKDRILIFSKIIS
tara:strand:+ start:440 stop:1273 length:834 start_codon:yes stop_codon:yes gene_type:complete